MDEFFSVYEKEADVGKRKMMAFERKGIDVCDFSTSYRACVPGARRCEAVLVEERIEEVKSKHSVM